MTRHRILHFIPTMGGGGAERQLAYIASGQRTQAWDVHVALYSGGPNLQRLRETGAVIHHVGIRGSYDVRSLAKAAALIRSTRADIVHTYLLQTDVVGGLAAAAMRTPWVLGERASGVTYYNDSLKNNLRVLVARTASAIEANSAAGVAYWAEKCPRVPRRVISCGLPFEEIEGAPAANLDLYRGERRLPLILFAGRFDEQKNVMMMLTALAELFRERDAVGILCGHGPLDDAVRSAIARLGIGHRVFLPGYVLDIWSWMKAADVFLSVSHFEGRPNTVLEAAACRTALIVSDIPEHREFLRQQQSALFADRNDALSIAAALRETIDDPAAARARAAAAFEIVSQFTIDAMTAELNDLYNDVLNGSPAAKRAGERRF